MGGGSQEPGGSGHGDAAVNAVGNAARPGARAGWVWAACLLGTALGLGVMSVGFERLAPPDASERVARLTDRGRRVFSPERDIPVYLAGCCASVGVSVGLAWLVQTVRGRYGRREPAGLEVGRETEPAVAPKPWVRRPGREGLWLGAVLCAVVLALAVPDVSWLAGRFWMSDAFHHWDYFAMAPALQLRHGRALGTEAYAQYGVGFPLLLNAMNPVVPIGYNTLIALAIGYSCVYFTALAALLREVLGSRLWATAGALAALNLQVFTGTNIASPIIWLYPSSTVLRYAFDVWFFLGLWFHLRTGRTLFMGWTGLALGLAVLWVTDTGIYLAVVALLYLSARALGPVRDDRGARVVTWKDPVALGAVAGSVALAGWGLASRGALGPGFFRGLFEAQLSYSGGFGCLPFRGQDAIWKAAFFLIAGTYLAAVGRVVAAVVVRVPVAPVTLFRGCLAAYGLASLLLYIQRSHPYNLSHVIVPFVVLATEGARSAAVGLGRRFRRLPGLVGASACVVAVLAIAGNPWVWAYPGYLQQSLRGPSRDRLCLTESVGVCGLTVWHADFVREFRSVSDTLSRLQADGARVAVLDYSEVIYCLASGVPPADRYCPLMPSIFGRGQLRGALERFKGNRFDYVMMREHDKDIDAHQFADVEAAFRGVLERDYVPWGGVGVHRIWKARPVPLASRLNPRLPR